MITTRTTRGPFIVVEGLDGAGTTTQVLLISQHLRSIGFETWTTREPSSGVIGRALRSAIEGEDPMTPETLALGFAADRLHHMYREGGIRDMLNDGVWVISDRYVLSALAYQSAQGVDLDWLVQLNAKAPTPDVTIFVDTPVRTCLDRIRQRASNLEDQFHQRSALLATRKEYLHALSVGEFIGKLVTADGRGDPHSVLRQILKGMTDELTDDFGLLAGVAPVADQH